MSEKALIAMSGGVDSSVSAFLSINMGYSCIGAMMKLLSHLGEECSCCTKRDIEDAQNVADRLKIPFYVFDFSDGFKEKVMDKFVQAYETGFTPNPCISCNRYFKFDKLFCEAEKLGCTKLITGHYARVEKNEENGRYILKKAVDPTKDQSYVLYSLSQEQLSKVYFPLGSMTKSEAREIARSNGFTNAEKHDSQDVCFIKNQSYFDFIESYTKKSYPEGDFVDTNGNVIGRHKGIIRYTVGQRKGLGISWESPLYVKDVNIAENKVVLCSNEELFSDTLYADNVNLISVDNLDTPMRVKAKIRYRHTEQPATTTVNDGILKVVFDSPQRAITKGQSVVLYDGENVVGGGTIISL